MLAVVISVWQIAPDAEGVRRTVGAHSELSSRGLSTARGANRERHDTRRHHSQLELHRCRKVYVFNSNNRPSAGRPPSCVDAIFRDCRRSSSSSTLTFRRETIVNFMVAASTGFVVVETVKDIVITVMTLIVVVVIICISFTARGRRWHHRCHRRLQHTQQRHLHQQEQLHGEDRACRGKSTVYSAIFYCKCITSKCLTLKVNVKVMKYNIHNGATAMANINLDRSNMTHFCNSSHRLRYINVSNV